MEGHQRRSQHLQGLGYKLAETSLGELLSLQSPHLRLSNSKDSDAKSEICLSSGNLLGMGFIEVFSLKEFIVLLTQMVHSIIVTSDF